MKLKNYYHISFEKWSKNNCTIYTSRQNRFRDFPRRRIDIGTRTVNFVWEHDPDEYISYDDYNCMTIYVAKSESELEHKYGFIINPSDCFILMKAVLIYNQEFNNNKLDITDVVDDCPNYVMEDYLKQDRHFNDNDIAVT